MSKRILVITLGATLVCAYQGSILAKNNLLPSTTPAESEDSPSSPAGALIAKLVK